MFGGAEIAPLDESRENGGGLWTPRLRTVATFLLHFGENLAAHQRIDVLL